MLTGQYCSECGQAADVERYTFGSFSHEIYGTLRKIDITTTFATAVALLRQPGVFIHGYLAGKRVGYIGPIKFFFYSLIADVIVRGWAYWLTGDPSYGSILTADTKVQVMALVSTLFWSVLWKLFYRKAGFNIAEFAVCAIFFESQANLLTIITLFISIPLKPFSPSIGSAIIVADFLIAAIYGFYFARQVFNESWPKTLFKQTILIALFAVCVMIVLSGELALQNLTYPIKNP